MPRPDAEELPPSAASSPAALFVDVYERLHAMATAALGLERRGHTLQPTAIVHEVYLRLGAQERAVWNGSEHFLAVASVVVRRVLVDHARSRTAFKRGSGQRGVALADSPEVRSWEEWVDLDDALLALSRLNARQAKVAECKVFAGMTNEQIASVLDVSRATVANDWAFARAWLSREVLDREP
jgi:RNA polymerase sigma factor (TIGR02999 family)